MANQSGLIMDTTTALLETKTAPGLCGDNRPQPVEGHSRHEASPPTDRWEQRFAELQAFKAEHGHCNVPQNHDNPSLTVWVYNCRRQRKQGKLSEERAGRLDGIGFCWSLRTRRFLARDWEAMSAELLAFKNCFGHCNVPHGWTRNPELAAWLHGVRCSKRAGKLDPARVRQLDELGVVWEPGQNRWEEMLASLVQYRERHGDCNVPGSWPENPKLAKWVKGLRSGHKQGALAADRRAELDALGFQWERGGDLRWEEMYDELAQFVRQHGHCCVSTTSTECKKLGNWVRTQRTVRRQGELSADRIRRLDALRFTWDLWQEQWDTMFAALVGYKVAFGHCDVPQTWEENRKLGNWVITQRMNYRKDKLDAQQIERLTALGFSFSLVGQRLTLDRSKKPQAAPHPTGPRRRAA
jgi:hypothetical protein